MKTIAHCSNEIASHAATRLCTVVLAVAPLALAACTGRDVVAKVDGSKIRHADLAAFGGARKQDPKTALDALVDRTLLAQAAGGAGLANDPAVQARLRAAEREILAQAYLEREVAASAGEDQLRRRYQDEQEQLAQREIHVAHIAVHVTQPSPAARAEAQSKASRVYARLTGGEPFEKVAREMSDDPVTAQRGGDLGPIREGQVDAKFFEAAVALKRGEVSKPVETAFGFHVVKALEDYKTVTPQFEEVKGLLAAEARREAEASLLASLRKKASVKVYPEHFPKPTKGESP